ncbi:hypothetical protein DPMN_008214 [Dreissena polymorpha]|uniref:Uncharacterized protein n=1 Tax=Dreissena polymorpha TaxID=45954 RepID=A0A9D4MUX7_DREPO|nr:hypothetical protein DPMN_008214 [Dreissena polymorpha]
MEQHIKTSQDLCSINKACPMCKCSCRMKKDEQKDGTLKKPSSGGKEITLDVFHSELKQYHKQRDNK